MNKNITIKLIFDNVALSVKVLGIFAICTLTLLFSACSNSDKVIDIDDGPAPNVSMTLKEGTDPVFMSNALIYVFNSNTSKTFVGQKHNVTKTGNTLFTYMPEGTWNLALLTCNQSLAGKITIPPYGGDITTPMWKTPTDATNKFLLQTPAELRYDLLNTTISEPVKTKENATLNRNVAKIQVILKEYTAFDAVNPGNQNEFAFVDLLDVPTTLNWLGGYYPDKDHPFYSDKPIREFFNFKSKIVGGVNQLVADPVDFIVPAHRGTDAFATQHNDTTTHKLRLKVSMPLNGDSYYGKTETPITISYVPKINRIIRLEIVFRGEPETKLDVKVTVKDWENTPDQKEEFK